MPAWRHPGARHGDRRAASATQMAPAGAAFKPQFDEGQCAASGCSTTHDLQESVVSRLKRHEPPHESNPHHPRRTPGTGGRASWASSIWCAKSVSPAGPNRILPVLGAMIYYIDTFPERFHHPKEDEWLFRLLHPAPPGGRTRCCSGWKSEHRSGATAAARYGAGAGPLPAGRPMRNSPCSQRRSKAYVAFERNHMRSEETEVFPLAQKYLTRGRLGGNRRRVSRPQGSAARVPRRACRIQQPFPAHREPRAPPPIGVGPARS